MSDTTPRRQILHDAVPTDAERREVSDLEAYRLTGTGLAECADCSEAVIVAFVQGSATQSQPKTEHRKLILDAVPDAEAGTVVLVPDRNWPGLRTFCRVLSDEDAAASQRPLLVPHEATCPGRPV